MLRRKLQQYDILLRVRKHLEDSRVLEHIAQLGTDLQREMRGMVEEFGLPVTVSPYPQMPFLHFDADLSRNQELTRNRFYGRLARDGVFAHPRHHGFLCWRHSAADMAKVLEACREACQSV